MLVTIGNDTRKAMKTLGIAEYPFSVKELKGAYYDQMKKWHPDIVSEAEKEKAIDKSKKINEAFESLQNLAIEDVEVYGDTEDKVVASTLREINDINNKDMFTHAELCPFCGGKKQIVKSRPSDVCRSCYGTGIYRRFKCNACDNGKFKLINGRVVDCKKCKGTGIYQLICHKCNGTGEVGSAEKTISYSCQSCQGKGYVIKDYFNPVIPKGSVL